MPVWPLRSEVQSLRADLEAKASREAAETSMPPKACRGKFKVQACRNSESLGEKEALRRSPMRALQAGSLGAQLRREAEEVGQVPADLEKHCARLWVFRLVMRPDTFCQAAASVEHRIAGWKEWTNPLFPRRLKG